MKFYFHEPVSMPGNPQQQSGTKYLLAPTSYNIVNTKKDRNYVYTVWFFFHHMPYFSSGRMVPEKMD